MNTPIRAQGVSFDEVVNLNDLDNNDTQNPTKPQILFEKIILDASKGFPRDENGEKVDLSGCIAITRDTKHKSLLHTLIWLTQKIHSFLFGRWDTDTDLVHASIVLKQDENEKKEGNLVLAHALMNGIHTSSQGYFNKNSKIITELVIWRPVDPNLRKLLSKHADQTAFDVKKEKEEGVNYRIRKAGFAVIDMIGSIFRGTCRTPSEGAMNRTARVVADLMLGNQINNKKDDGPHQFFCTSYVMSVLQGSLLVQALSEENKNKLLYDEDGNMRSREELAHIIYCKISRRNDASTFSKAYWNSRICQLNAKYLQSCYAGEALDEVSRPAELAQT